MKSRVKLPNDEAGLKEIWWWFDLENKNHICEDSAAWEILRRTQSYRLLERRIREYDREIKAKMKECSKEVERFKGKFIPPRPGDFINDMKDPRLHEMALNWAVMISKGWTADRSYLQMFELCRRDRSFGFILSSPGSVKGFELRRMKKVEVQFLPPNGKRTVIIADIIKPQDIKRKHHWHFRVFDEDGIMILDRGEDEFLLFRHHLDRLRNLLSSLDSSTELSDRQSRDILEIIESILVRTICLPSIVENLQSGPMIIPRQFRLESSGLFAAEAFHVERIREAELRGYDLRVVRLSSLCEFPSEGTSSVVVASANYGLHFRVFNSIGQKIVDKSEAELPPNKEAELAKLRHRLTAFAEDVDISKNDKQQIIGKVASVLGPIEMITDSFPGKLVQCQNIPELIPDGRMSMVWIAILFDLSLPVRARFRGLEWAWKTAFPDKRKLPDWWTTVIDDESSVRRSRSACRFRACPDSVGKCVALVPASCSHDVAYALFRSMFSKKISPVERKSLKAEWIARRTQLYCDDKSSVDRSDYYKARRSVLKELRPINKALPSKPIIPDDALIALGAFDCGLGESLQRKCLTKLSRKNAPKVCENYYGGDFSQTCETGRKLIIEQIDQVFYRLI